ncbi:MAG: hypothetical protein WC389_22695 [Lutibacter sp.]|jgi:hypothetical protein
MLEINTSKAVTTVYGGDYPTGSSVTIYQHTSSHKTTYYVELTKQELLMIIDKCFSKDIPELHINPLSSRTLGQPLPIKYKTIDALKESK